MATKKISALGAGDIFHFTSIKNKKNTGYYGKLNSSKNKGVNLSTWKTVIFASGDVGTPHDAELKINKL